MPRPTRRPARFWVLSVVSVLFLSACDDDFFTIRWDARPDTVSLFSLARPELNLPSAFNFNARVLVEIEASTATGNWDVAIDTQDGQLVFLTPRTIGIESEAGITPVDGSSFEDLRQAPGDTVRYATTEPVPITLNQLYVVRTDESAGNFGQRCNYFAKLQPLRVDPEIGIVEFLYDSNPVCNDRDLIPPN